jgi:hypothetical protein
MSSNNDHTSEGSTRINVLSDEEVARWCAYFGMTEHQLRNVVFLAGPTVEEVEAWLKEHGLSKP